MLLHGAAAVSKNERDMPLTENLKFKILDSELGRPLVGMRETYYVKREAKISTYDASLFAIHEMFA